MKKILLLFLACLFVSACTTQPYVRYKSPAISGTLLVNDTPAQAIALFLSLDASDTECRHYVQRVHSDEQGNFLLQAEKEHMDYTPLMTHYLDEWTLCAEINGVRRTLYSNNRYGMGSVGRQISLICRFDTRGRNEQPCEPVMDK